MKYFAIFLLFFAPFALLADISEVLLKPHVPSDSEIAAFIPVLNSSIDIPKNRKMTPSEAYKQAEYIQTLLPVVEKPALQFLFRAKAFDFYVCAGDYDRANSMILSLDSIFCDFDSSQFYTDMLEVYLKNYTRKGGEELFLIIFDQIRHAVSCQNFKLAHTWIASILKHPRKFEKFSHWNLFLKYAYIVQKASDYRKKARSAKTELAKSPHNPTANLRYAELLLLAGAPWKVALPYLRKAKHPNLRRFAQLEAENRVNFSNIQDVANFYWDFAQSAKGDIVSVYQIHALDYFFQMRDDLNSESLALWEERLKEPIPEKLEKILLKKKKSPYEGLDPELRRILQNIALYKAIRENNLPAVKEALSYGVDLNSQLNSQKYSGYPADLAFELAHFEIMMLLVENGAYYDLRSVVAHGDLNIIKYLIDREPEAVFSYIYIDAIKRGNFEIVKYLIENGPVPNTTPDYEEDDFLAAVFRHGNFEIVKYFVEMKGLDPHKKTKNGTSMMYYAVHNNNCDVELIKYLDNKGVKFEKEYSFSSCDWGSPGRLGVVRYLEGKGVRINLDIKESAAYLYEAKNSGNIEAVKYLLNERRLNKNGQIPIETNVAISNGDLEMLKYLLSIGGKFSDPRYIMCEACRSGNLEMVKFCAVRGGAVNLSFGPDQGRRKTITPLMYACQTGNLDLVKYLVERGADINAKNPCYWDTALFHTVCTAEEIHRKASFWEPRFGKEKTYCEIAKYLIEKGADVNVIYFPIGFVYYKSDQDYDIKDVLKNYHHYDTIIDYPAKCGNLEMVQYLIKKGAITDWVNTQYPSGTNHLMCSAVSSGNLELIKYLVEEKGLSVLAEKAFNDDYFIGQAINGENPDVVLYIIQKQAEQRKKLSQKSSNKSSAKKSSVSRP